MTPTLPFYPLMFKNVTIRLPLIYELNDVERQEVLDGLTALLEAGALDHQIAGTFPLAEAAAAHELVEAATTPGCVIVEP
jgi:NADPH2:quinone reductase